jgi:hypothetical protein
VSRQEHLNQDSSHRPDGFAVVRLSASLNAPVPFEAGVTFDSTLPLSEARHWADINKIYRTDPAEPLQLQPYWHSGQFLARMSDRPAADLHHGHTVAKDADQEHGYIEVCIGSTITMGCAHCVDYAIDRAMLAVDAVLDTWQQVFTFAAVHAVTLKTTRTKDVDRAFTVAEFDANQQSTVRSHGPFIADSHAPEAFTDFADGRFNERVKVALLALGRRRELYPFIDFFADAIRSYQHYDELSGGLLFAALASESILDLTLLHLLWWDGVDPAEAGQILKPGVTSRTKFLPNYANRIGGSWDGSTGPIRSWKEAVADPRNRVAHGGRHATSDEVERAIGATNELYEYLRLLADGEKARRNYPLLISMLSAGLDENLSKRQMKALSAYYDDPERPMERFFRYIAACNKERSIAFGNPIDPSAEFADGVAVFSNDEIASWWLFDREAFSVIQVQDPHLGDAMMTALTEEYRRRQPSAVAGHMHFEVDKTLALGPKSFWIGADHLPGMEFRCTIAAQFRR